MPTDPIHPLEFIELPRPAVTLDLRWMGLPADLLDQRAELIAAALDERAELEGGMIANPDEGRQVGHYWLRDPERAPTVEHTHAIRSTKAQIEALVADLKGRFPTVISIGIGGSALGPQLIADALWTPSDPRRVLFIDNTDPAGVARVLAQAGPLGEVLVLVISKSGGTAETRNGSLLVAEAFAAAGVDFASHAVAITGAGSALYELSEGWIARLPMWDWVGGRTSVMSAVGLVPMLLQGIDIDALLEGARLMDAATRRDDPAENPAMAMALAWLHATEGRAKRANVVLPYKDSLLLFSRYLQQLVMESLGKRLDRRGQVVHQGLAVYGNKGSTDQHAFVQQLRGGPDDFFVTFIEVLEDGGSPLEVKPGDRAGDFLSGFLAGTRAALSEAGRRSLTLTIPRVDALHLGALIALFERAVSFYATFVDINAYHQPGVEAGKKAAAKLLELQGALLAALSSGATGDAEALAEPLGADPRDAFHILRHLAANGRARATGQGLARVFSAP